MPALRPTDLYGSIVWLGHIADRSVSLCSQPAPRLDAWFAGIVGEDHGGLTRSSCSRVEAQYSKGTEIRNTRQLSIVSMEELAEIASEIGVAKMHPEWVGATMAVKGFPDFTHIPPSSRLQTEAGTTLVVDVENRPCTLPGKVIDEDAPGHGLAFNKAARGRRGITAWVEREGPLVVGHKVRLHIPDQQQWAELARHP